VEKIATKANNFRKTFYVQWLIILLALLCSISIFAEQKIQFEKVDIGSNRSIGSGFIQDSDGFFWIGAQPGLIKFLQGKFMLKFQKE